MPLVELLRLSAAARYERYGGLDEVTTPKLGLVYQPHRDVTVRASWGKSFKVPTLNQMNQVLQGALLPAPLEALALGGVWNSEVVPASRGTSPTRQRSSTPPVGRCRCA